MVLSFIVLLSIVLYKLYLIIMIFCWMLLVFYAFLKEFFYRPFHGRAGSGRRPNKSVVWNTRFVIIMLPPKGCFDYGSDR